MTVLRHGQDQENPEIDRLVAPAQDAILTARRVDILHAADVDDVKLDTCRLMRSPLELMWVSSCQAPLLDLCFLLHCN